MNTTAPSVRHDLEVLAEEFQRCSLTYPPLYHERFMAWQDGGHEKLTDEQWALFTVANPEPPDEAGMDWWCWNGPWPVSDVEEMMGRFVGHEDGLQEFLTLADNACTLVKELDEKEARGSGGYDGWLYLLHSMALLFPSLMLESEVSTWGDEDIDGKTTDQLRLLL